MKMLLLLLFLASCATSKPECVKVADEQIYDTRVVEYQCSNYTKYCKFSENQSLGCFTQRAFQPREWIE